MACRRLWVTGCSAVLSSSRCQPRECPRSLPLQKDSTGTNCAPPDRLSAPRSLRGNLVFHVLYGERTRREHGKISPGFHFSRLTEGGLQHAPRQPCPVPCVLLWGSERGSQVCVDALGKPHAHATCLYLRPCLEAGSGRGQSAWRGVGSPCRRGISVRSCLCSARPHVLVSLRCCAHTPPAAQAGTRALCGRDCWPAWLLDPCDVIEWLSA